MEKLVSILAYVAGSHLCGWGLGYAVSIARYIGSYSLKSKVVAGTSRGLPVLVFGGKPI